MSMERTGPARRIEALQRENETLRAELAARDAGRVRWLGETAALTPEQEAAAWARHDAKRKT